MRHKKPSQYQVGSHDALIFDENRIFAIGIVATKDSQNMEKFAYLAAVLVASAKQASAVSFTIPAQVGASGYKYTPLDPAPVGVSYAFHLYGLLYLISADFGQQI